MINNLPGFFLELNVFAQKLFALPQASAVHEQMTFVERGALLAISIQPSVD
jgi:hypothetical protein